MLTECDEWLEWSVWPHSCLLYGFPASSLTWHISLPGTSAKRNAHTRLHIHAHIHAHAPPCSLSLFLGRMHADTHICHLHGDSRGIGLWWEIYTSDRWALLGLTRTESRVAAEEDERRVGGMGTCSQARMEWLMQWNHYFDYTGVVDLASRSWR